MDKGLSVSFTSRERPPKEPKKEQRSIDGSGDNFLFFGGLVAAPAISSSSSRRCVTWHLQNN